MLSRRNQMLLTALAVLGSVSRAQALRWADAPKRSGEGSLFPDLSTVSGPAVELRAGAPPQVHVEAWGDDSLRIRWLLAGGTLRTDLPGALSSVSPAPRPSPARPSDYANGNIRCQVSSEGLVTVTRVDDGRVLLRQLSAAVQPCSGNHSIEGCTTKTTIEFASPPEEMLFGTGQHMNQVGIAGRLPAVRLQPYQGAPRVDMKGGAWDFESCTVYTDSMGAEICVPWLLAATPPALLEECAAQQGTEAVGAVYVSDENAEGIHATQHGCCSQCAAVKACELWLHQASLNHCWLLRSNGTAVRTRPAPDRALGWKVNASSSGAYSAGGYEYGMLWNMPNFGRMELGDHSTRWTAHDVVNGQVDVFVATHRAGTGGSTAAAQHILHRYVDATGHAPLMPEWAAGYWHSPIGSYGYNQSAVEAAAEGLHARGIPTDLFVIDYFNWRRMGDFAFNPQAWPAPAAMAARLHSLGMRLMVSAWPFVLKSGARASAAINGSDGRQLAVHDSAGQPVAWPDAVCEEECYAYDPTSPAARAFVFEMLQSGYVQRGVRSFWFDSCEPESLAGRNHTVSGVLFDNPLGQPRGATLHLGTNEQVGMMYPYFHAQTAYEGLRALFPGEVPVTLARGGWAGAQRFGAAHWNGDLHATWTNLKKTLAAGLNAQLSGLGWWTHDIGALNGGDNADPHYRELLVRWFQLGVTSPIFRQHGNRPIEPWALEEHGASGRAAYRAVLRAIRLRYALRPYLLTLMASLSAQGAPVNRPLHWDFPRDPPAWFVTDQFMFGPAYLVAPVTDLGVRERHVYFPRGHCAAWKPFAAAYYSENGTHAAGAAAVIPVAFDELAMFECIA